MELQRKNERIRELEQQAFVAQSKPRLKQVKSKSAFISMKI